MRVPQRQANVAPEAAVQRLRGSAPCRPARAGSSPAPGSRWDTACAISTSTRARVRTLAAVVSAKPMNQNCDASAPRKPAPSEGRQAAKLASSAFRSKSAEPDQEDRGLQAQAPDQGRGGPHQRGALVEGQDRAAEADRRERQRRRRRRGRTGPVSAGGRQARARLHRHEQHARRSRPRSPAPWPASADRPGAAARTAPPAPARSWYRPSPPRRRAPAWPRASGRSPGSA